MSCRCPALKSTSFQNFSRAAAFAAVMTSGSGAALADDDRALVSAQTGVIVATVHAIGAQIYECKADGRGGLAWAFREPIATLISDGKTVGRHFAGPSWEMADGSLVSGKVVGKAPGTSADDIPWLRLEVVQHVGSGILQGVTTVQRIHTAGGIKAGPCSTEGVIAAEPYTADYVFSRQ